jgi:cytidylate kinase
VRKALLIFQKDVAKSPVGAVLDGRDIGTEVCPDADLKFFITASIETRAKRRFKQLQILGKDVIYSDILHDLEARDRRDKNRQVAPLISAEDAVSIDTTDMNHEEVFEMVCAIVDAK